LVERDKDFLGVRRYDIPPNKPRRDGRLRLPGATENRKLPLWIIPGLVEEVVDVPQNGISSLTRK
jgi:hypothetical protein